MFESVEDNSYVKTVQCQFPVSSSSRPRSGRPMTPSVDKISEPSETRATWWWWCPVITHNNCHNSSIFLVPEMSGKFIIQQAYYAYSKLMMPDVNSIYGSYKGLLVYPDSYVFYQKFVSPLISYCHC